MNTWVERRPIFPPASFQTAPPNIRGEPVWVDLNKVKAEVTTYEEIVQMSKKFLRRNPHLKERFEVWKAAHEGEVLIKGNVAPQAVSTKMGVRLKTAARYGGRALLLYAIYADTRSFIAAEDRSGEASRIAGGWIGAWAGACAGGATGAKGGAALAVTLGFAGPQAAAPLKR